MAEKKLKVALVITRMDRGGAPDIVKGLFCHLKDRGYDVTLISGPTTAPSKEIKDFMDSSRSDVHVVPELTRDPSPVSDIKAMAELFLLFRKEKFDVVHTHTAKAGFLGRIAARLAGVRIVIHTPHGHNFYGYFGSIGSALVIALEKIAAFFADRITVLTDMEKKDMIERDICKVSKITVVRSGVDLAKYDKKAVDVAARKKELGAGPADLLVGMISRLDAVKGPEYFIDAAKYVSESLPQVKFIVVGDGPLKEELVSRAKRMGVGGSVIFAGWREDIDEILPALDIVVLTSLNEAVGRVLLEAGASSKPVVATDVGGIPEVLKDNVTGILVPPADAKSIADAVLGLLKDGERRRRMGEAARNWVRDNFDEKRMFEEISDLYEELVKA